MAIVSSSPAVLGRLDLVLRRGQQAFITFLPVCGGLPVMISNRIAPEQVDVAGRADALDRAQWPFPGPCRPACRPCCSVCVMLSALRNAAVGQRQAPVHHQHFAEVAEHDVLGLEIAMDHAAGVGEGDGVGHLHQDFDVLGERFFADRPCIQGVPWTRFIE